MTTPQPKAEDSPRISAPASATLVTPDGRRIDLPVKELSRSQVFLSTPTLLVEVGAVMTVEIASLDRARSVTLAATVVKAVMAPPEEGSGLLGLRLQFVDVSPEQEQQLGQLLIGLLEGPGGQRRAYPRISHRMVVSCASSGGSRAVLRNISLGGAGLWSEKPLSLGEEVTLEMARSGKATLAIPATVVDARPVQGDEPYHAAGLRFRELSPEVKGELRAFLMSLLVA